MRLFFQDFSYYNHLSLNKYFGANYALGFHLFCIVLKLLRHILTRREKKGSTLETLIFFLPNFPTKLWVLLSLEQE